MRKFLTAAAAALVVACFSAPAKANHLVGVFDCGKEGGVSMQMQLDHNQGSKGSVSFDILIHDVDFDASPIVKSPVVRWNVKKHEVTLDGRQCQQVKEDQE
jgi:hypothetical protein